MTVSSHRYTTSSRQPGAIRHGVTQYEPAGIRRCEDCRAICSDLVWPHHHAPHWVAGRLVNCVGKPIPEGEFTDAIPAG
jgi:hypothetical protein